MKNLIKTDIIIEEMSREFQRSPFDFLYESDIQGLLYSRLREELKDDVTGMEAGTYYPDHFEKREQVKTSIVKTEYPSAVKGLGLPGRFDIAVLNDEKSYRRVDINIEGLANEIFWNLPVTIGLEIKLFRPGDKISYMFNRFRADIEKLESYSKKVESPFFGRALLFVLSYMKCEEQIKNWISAHTLSYKRITGRIVTPDQIFTMP
ncbi:MAG: hypothetical protein JSU74_01735 [Candidatus Zixiibacteriota bacterium]|nr:MAG: hypothetical protein JSU74_01735 [candidate division Zixibacteria bacterium]